MHFVQVGMPGTVVMDVMVLNRFRSRYKFLLVCIDAVTRFLFTSFLQTLNSRNVTNAFVKLLENQYKWHCSEVFTDQGRYCSMIMIFFLKTLMCRK